MNPSQKLEIRKVFKLSFVISAPSVNTEVAKKMRRMRQLGFDGVELAIKQPRDIDASDLKIILKSCGLTVPAIGTGKAWVEEGLSLSHTSKANRESAIKRIKDHIRLASSLETMVIIGLIRGNLSKDIPRQDSLNIFRESLSICLDYAGENGVTLVLEPINRYEVNFLNNVPETVDFIKSMRHPHLKMLADSFHMNIEDKSFRESLHTAAPYLVHVHFADSNRHFPGSGHIDFKEIIDTLGEISYNGFVSGEMLPEPSEIQAMKSLVTFMQKV